MAENKKGVILYADLIHTFDELSDAEAGRLIKHFFRYVNDKNPEAPDKLTKLLFQPIKLQLKRDLEKWETIREKRSEAGKRSAEKRAQDQQEVTNPTSVEFCSTNPTVNDTVTVNVTDTVINKELIIEEEIGENFELTIDSKKIKNLKAYVRQTFPKMEESLKMKVSSKKYSERQDDFILRNNEGSYTSEKDFRNHYTNFILKKPPPEKEKYSGQKEKPSRTEQILDTFNQVNHAIINAASA